MNEHLTCTDEPHVHTTVWPQVYELQPRCPLLLIDGTVMGVIPSIALAERVAYLLRTYGLLDTVDDLTPASWPPPAGPAASTHRFQKPSTT